LSWKVAVALTDVTGSGVPFSTSPTRCRYPAASINEFELNTFRTLSMAATMMILKARNSISSTEKLIARFMLILLSLFLELPLVPKL